MRTPPIVESLRELVGDDNVLTDRDLRAGYEQDWTGRYGADCDGVVRPGSTDEVAAVLATCNEHGVDLVPQGGNTGLVGGGVPRPRRRRPSVVMSTNRMRGVTDLDPDAMALTAASATTIAEWQAAAREVGLDTPIDFAARDSATIGGAIATNAGGSRVVRFGTMRHQVIGIEAVLANGSVVGSLAGLPKETVGLHWPSVLAGSEGTLAVITSARLRLVPRYAHVTTAMVSMSTLADGIALAGAIRRRLGSLDAVEIIEPDAIALVAAHLGATVPVEVEHHGTVLIVECADHTDPAAELLAVIEAAHGVVGSAVAVDPTRRHHLLRFRDRITEAIAAASSQVPAFKLDVAVPVGLLDSLLAVARRAAAADGARLIPFGHLAEGNLHLNYLSATDPIAIADLVLGAVGEMGGTISAEHGIGVAKTPWLHLVRSSADLAAQRAIKLAVDPNDILNPGVLDPGDHVP